MTLARGSESIGQRAIAVELIEHDGEDAYDQARITINAPELRTIEGAKVAA